MESLTLVGRSSQSYEAGSSDDGIRWWRCELIELIDVLELQVERLLVTVTDSNDDNASELPRRAERLTEEGIRRERERRVNRKQGGGDNVSLYGKGHVRYANAGTSLPLFVPLLWRWPGAADVSDSPVSRSILVLPFLSFSLPGQFIDPFLWFFFAFDFISRPDLNSRVSLSPDLLDRLVFNNGAPSCASSCRSFPASLTLSFAFFLVNNSVLLTSIIMKGMH